MSFGSLHNNPLILGLAKTFDANDSNAMYAGLPKGSVRGTVTSVDDPNGEGRIKVKFDAMNGEDIPQADGTGEEYTASRVADGSDESGWIKVSPAFKGKQPPGLVGKRVNIVVTGGQYQYAVAGDVICDDDEIVNKVGIPDNSSMTRLPCYPAGSEPPASAENVGCCIVITGGFDGMDWLSVCLKRSGGYKWVNMMDRLHIHDSQEVDGAGDKENQVNDDTHATT